MPSIGAIIVIVGNAKSFWPLQEDMRYETGKSLGPVNFFAFTRTLATSPSVASEKTMLVISVESNLFRFINWPVIAESVDEF